ncbi:MAG TPA: MFS transporter [Stellaceae bacterium]|nr:MFS transporter [Stellaceae bacterium]
MTGRSPGAPVTVETGRSWLVAFTALGVLSVSFGAPMITVVALQPISAAFGNLRSVPSLSISLAWLGSALGGIVLAQVAERIGVRWTVIFGALMIAVGLLLASRGERLSFYIGHGVFIGLFGNAGINAPLYVYVSRWFDRRRGTALALISSGQAAAGTIWAPLFGHAINFFGWAGTMRLYAGCEIALILPAAFLVFRALPRAVHATGPAPGPAPGASVLGMKSRTALGLVAAASFMCCVPMAMPQGHLVAYCGDLGISLTSGSAMLSLLLACAFVGRQCWGFVADRIGGLRTVLAGSACQAVAMTGFILTRNEAGLFAVSMAFGLGFSGIIPAYVVAVRELFPASEAAWRIPTVLLFSGSGMAAGGWLAGVIYDDAGFYAPAFAAGILFNLANLLLVGTLVVRQNRFPAPLLARA